MLLPNSKASCLVTRVKPDSSPLSFFYEAFVPAKVQEIGLLPWDTVRDEIPKHIEPLRTLLHQPEAAEAIIFGSQVSRDLAREGRMKLLEALAWLSFCPGGVEFCGIKYVSTHEDQENG